MNELVITIRNGKFAGAKGDNIYYCIPECVMTADWKCTINRDGFIRCYSSRKDKEGISHQIRYSIIPNVWREKLILKVKGKVKVLKNCKITNGGIESLNGRIILTNGTIDERNGQFFYEEEYEMIKEDIGNQ